MNNSSIGFTQLSIGNVFTNAVYIVPDYQREYVWKQEQIDQLINDLLEASNVKYPKPYFLGTIVTYHGSDGTFELIDGQQRLTTFFLLLCAIKQRYSKDNIDTTSIAYQLYSTSIGINGVPQPSYRLELQYVGSNNCLDMIYNDKPQSGVLTESEKSLFKAYDSIKETLDKEFPDSDKEKFQEFVGFVFNMTNFIRIETYDISDALKIFETINQRGVGLDSMDLLKNMLFRSVSRKEFSDLNGDWKSITKTIENIKEKPLRFLRYFIMANYDTSDCKDGILREDDIYNWLTKNNNQCRYKEEPFKFVQKMKENVEAYAKYREPNNNDNGDIHLKNIPLLAGSSYKLHLMLMLAAVNMNEEAKAKFKGVIESVVYYTVINRITTNETERLFVDWCSRIRKIKTANELDNFIESQITPKVNGWKADNEINFMRLGLNSMQQYRIKFILGKITAYVDAMLLSKTTVDDLSSYIDSAVDIEHIMPQTCDDKSAYKITDEEYDLYINRLGNLTLLENSINRSIHNDNYKEKSQSYKASKFHLTRSLPELVDQGQNNAITRTNKMLRAWSEWTKDSIDERQKMLYELSERIWSLSPSAT